MFRSVFTAEARLRPYYSGTGSVALQPSLGGYHVMDMDPGERWILEPGVYRGQCAELCGKDHGFMPVVVKVTSEEEFDNWIAGNARSRVRTTAFGADRQFSQRHGLTFLVKTKSQPVHDMDIGQVEPIDRHHDRQMRPRPRMLAMMIIHSTMGMS